MIGLVEKAPIAVDKVGSPILNSMSFWLPITSTIVTVKSVVSRPVAPYSVPVKVAVYTPAWATSDSTPIVKSVPERVCQVAVGTGAKAIE